jgi:hypothetical protein
MSRTETFHFTPLKMREKQETDNPVRGFFMMRLHVKRMIGSLWRRLAGRRQPTYRQYWLSPHIRRDIGLDVEESAPSHPADLNRR